MRKLITVVSATIALVFAAAALAQSGFDPNGQCVADANFDDEVSISELVTGINNALHGCDLQPMNLEFEARVGDEPFACGNTYSGIGTNGADLKPADFRFYLSDIRLVSADGAEVSLRLEQDGVWQYENLVLLDFEDKVGACDNGTVQTNTTVRGWAPAGDYTGVRFVLGVPFGMNHQRPQLAPSPLNLTSLWWNWQAGYKFIRVDDAADLTRIHLGSTGCQADDSQTEVTSCAQPNRAEVLLRGMDLTSDRIIADLAVLFGDSGLGSNQPDTKPGCQSEPFDEDCGPIFTNLGINFDNGLPDLSRQQFFRAE